LSPRSIYLVVFKLSDKNYEEKLDYWLKVINFFGRHTGSSRIAPIILVGTHLDSCTPQHVEKVQEELQKYKRKFFGIKGEVFVSSTKRIGIPQLYNHLQSVARDEKFMKAFQVPKYYLVSSFLFLLSPKLMFVFRKWNRLYLN